MCFLSIAVYAPNIPRITETDFKSGLQSVEECIMYVNEKYDCLYVFVCGDLNSRTSDRNNYCNNDVHDENSDSESEGGVGSPWTKR